MSSTDVASHVCLWQGLLALMGPQMSTFHWASLHSWGLRCPSVIGLPSTHGASMSIFHWASLHSWGLRCPSLIGPPTPSSSTRGASNVHLPLGLLSSKVPQMSIFDWASLHSWGLICPFLISTHGASSAHLWLDLLAFMEPQMSIFHWTSLHSWTSDVHIWLGPCHSWGLRCPVLIEVQVFSTSGALHYLQPGLVGLYMFKSDGALHIDQMGPSASSIDEILLSSIIEPPVVISDGNCSVQHWCGPWVSSADGTNSTVQHLQKYPALPGTQMSNTDRQKLERFKADYGIYALKAIDWFQVLKERKDLTALGSQPRGP